MIQKIAIKKNPNIGPVFDEALHTLLLPLSSSHPTVCFMVMQKGGGNN